MCARGTDFASFNFNRLIGFWNCSDSVVFFFVFHFIFMIITEDGRKKNQALQIDKKQKTNKQTKNRPLWLH